MCATCRIAAALRLLPDREAKMARAWEVLATAAARTLDPKMTPRETVTLLRTAAQDDPATMAAMMILVETNLTGWVRTRAALKRAMMDEAEQNEHQRQPEVERHLPAVMAALNALWEDDGEGEEIVGGVPPILKTLIEEAMREGMAVVRIPQAKRRRGIGPQGN